MRLSLFFFIGLSGFYRFILFLSGYLVFIVLSGFSRVIGLSGFYRAIKCLSSYRVIWFLFGCGEITSSRHALRPRGSPRKKNVPAAYRVIGLSCSYQAPKKKKVPTAYLSGYLFFIGLSRSYIVFIG